MKISKKNGSHPKFHTYNSNQQTLNSILHSLLENWHLHCLYATLCHTHNRYIDQHNKVSHLLTVLSLWHLTIWRSQQLTLFTRNLNVSSTNYTKIMVTHNHESLKHILIVKKTSHLVLHSDHGWTNLIDNTKSSLFSRGFPTLMPFFESSELS